MSRNHANHNQHHPNSFMQRLLSTVTSLFGVNVGGGGGSGTAHRRAQSGGGGLQASRSGPPRGSSGVAVNTRRGHSSRAGGTTHSHAVRRHQRHSLNGTRKLSASTSRPLVRTATRYPTSTATCNNRSSPTSSPALGSTKPLIGGGVLFPSSGSRLTVQTKGTGASCGRVNNNSGNDIEQHLLELEVTELQTRVKQLERSSLSLREDVSTQNQIIATALATNPELAATVLMSAVEDDQVDVVRDLLERFGVDPTGSRNVATQHSIIDRSQSPDVRNLLQDKMLGR